jgi:hypothetical protein
VTHLRQIMLDKLERRNYALGTITSYIRTVEHFARHFQYSSHNPYPHHAPPTLPAASFKSLYPKRPHKRFNQTNRRKWALQIQH